MKIPSINFNEGGKHFCFAFNYYSILFFIAVAIPYPWWSDQYRKSNSLAYGHGWHIKYKVLQFGIHKKLKV